MEHYKTDNRLDLYSSQGKEILNNVLGKKEPFCYINLDTEKVTSSLYLYTYSEIDTSKSICDNLYLSIIKLPKDKRYEIIRNFSYIARFDDTAKLIICDDTGKCINTILITSFIDIFSSI